MPVRYHLHSILGQHTQLGVLDGDEVHLVECLSVPGAVINYTSIAGRHPLAAFVGGGPAPVRPRELQERGDSAETAHADCERRAHRGLTGGGRGSARRSPPGEGAFAPRLSDRNSRGLFRMVCSATALAVGL
jgi:hypothetical protein